QYKAGTDRPGYSRDMEWRRSIPRRVVSNRNVSPAPRRRAARTCLQLAAKNYFSTYYGHDHLAGHLPSIKRRVARLGARARYVVGPLLLRIEDRHIGN